MESLLLDIEATFEKSNLWPKSNIMSRAQGDTMVKLLTDIELQIQKIEVIPLKVSFFQRLGLALKSLWEHPNIIIAKEDKGDVMFVLDSEHYYCLAN